MRTRTRVSVELPDRERWNQLRARPANSVAQPQWFRIANAAGKDDGPAVVDIYGEIGGSWWDETAVTAADFLATIRDISNSQIELHINSGGGDVYDGIAIYQALLDHPSSVTVKVDALAASAASFIAQAGDRVIMGANAEMMIHDALGYCLGNAADMRDFAGMLDKASDNIASIYTARAGNGSLAKWRARMTDETWYSAAEAVEVGLADEFTKVPKRQSPPANDVDRSTFKHRARAEAPDPEIVAEPETPPELATPAVVDVVDFDDISWDPKTMHLAMLDAADSSKLGVDTGAMREALEGDWAYDPDALKGLLLDMLDRPEAMPEIPPVHTPARFVDIDEFTTYLSEAMTP